MQIHDMVLFFNPTHMKAVFNVIPSFSEKPAIDWTHLRSGKTRNRTVATLIW